MSYGIGSTRHSINEVFYDGTTWYGMNGSAMEPDRAESASAGDGEAAYASLLQSARIYHYFVHGTLAVCTVLLALLMFLIFKKSPSGMQLSKWILIDCTITSYLIVALIAYWQPVPAPPPYASLANFCLGPLRGTDEHTSNLAYKLLVGLVFNLCICYSLEFAYQCAYVSRIAVPARAHLHYRNRIYGAVIAVYLVTTSFVSLFIYRGLDMLESGGALWEARYAPGSLLALLREREPTLTSFVVRGSVGVLFVLGLLALTAVLAAVIISLNLKFIHMLSAMKAALHADTFSLQLTLYRFFLTKTLIVFFMVILPILFVIFALISELDTSRVQLIPYYALPLHMPLLYLHTIFFFKPYQRYMFIKLGLAANSHTSTVGAQTG